MREDAPRWDTRYRRRRDEARPEPDRTLVGHRDLLPGRGWAIDVACGRGGDTVWLAEQGYQTIGLDCSLEGLKQAQSFDEERRVVSYIAVDVERFVWPRAWFSLLSVVRYLNRALFPSFKDTVSPGGLIFYKTFNRRHLENTDRFNPAYVLEHGELARIFADWHVLSTNDTTHNEETFSYVVARKPG